MTNSSGTNSNSRAADGPQGEGTESPSSFPRYAEYKDSGIEWLGEVPGQWRVQPLKSVCTCNDDVLDESTPPERQIKYVEISDVDALNGIVALPHSECYPA